MPQTKSQIDRLGERLKAGGFSNDDLMALDDFRMSFATAYESVLRTVQGELHLEPTGRSAKSTSSIIEKLRRESIRLTQMQDIAGCRIILLNRKEQDALVEQLRRIFTMSSVVDRRRAPSHGYRAVHVVPMIAGKAVEIQVRTRFQHLWAELSERLSDVVDPGLKYGAGPEEHREFLMTVASRLAVFEEAELEILYVLRDLNAIESETADRQVASVRQRLDEQLRGYFEAYIVDEE